MKKILAVFMVLILMLSMTFSVFADNKTDTNDTTTDDGSDDNTTIEINNTVEINETDGNETYEDNGTSEDETESEVEDLDEETEAEVESMGLAVGKKLRVLQLIDALKIKVEVSSEIVAYIADGDSEADVSELEALVAKLEALLEQAEAIDSKGEDAVEEFVAVKKASIEVVKEFRKLSREFLSEEDRDALREIIRKIRKEVRDESKEEKIQLRRELNRQRLNRFLDNVGLKAGEIKEQLENGEITAIEAVKQLKGKYNDLSSKKKAVIRKKVHSQVVKNKIVARKIAKNIKERLDDKRLVVKKRAIALRNDVKERIKKVEKYKIINREELIANRDIRIKAIRAREDANSAEQRRNITREAIQEHKALRVDAVQAHLDVADNTKEDE